MTNTSVDNVLRQLVITELAIKQVSEDRDKLCQQLLAEFILEGHDDKVFRSLTGDKTELIYSTDIDGETYRVIATLELQVKQTKAETVENGILHTISSNPVLSGIKMTELEICKVSKLF